MTSPLLDASVFVGALAGGLVVGERSLGLAIVAISLLLAAPVLAFVRTFNSAELWKSVPS